MITSNSLLNSQGYTTRAMLFQDKMLEKRYHSSRMDRREHYKLSQQILASILGIFVLLTSFCIPMLGLPKVSTDLLILGAECGSIAVVSGIALAIVSYCKYNYLHQPLNESALQKELDQIEAGIQLLNSYELKDMVQAQE